MKLLAGCLAQEVGIGGVPAGEVGMVVADASGGRWRLSRATKAEVAMYNRGVGAAKRGMPGCWGGEQGDTAVLVYPRPDRDYDAEWTVAGVGG